MPKLTFLARGLMLALAAPLAAVTVPARAARLNTASPIIAQVEAGQIQVNARPPIPFKPFAMVDPHTGQPVAPNALITLHNGKQIKASVYFSELNQLEQQFNAIGYTLRDPSLVHLQALKVNPQQLQAQAAMIQALPSAVAPSASAGAANGAHVAAVIRHLPPGIALPIAYGSQSMSKNWDYALGSTDTLAAELSGQLNVTGSQQGVTANAATRASGAILGNEWDLLRANGSINAPQSGPLSAKVTLYVVGVGDLPLLDKTASQPALNASDSHSEPLDVHQDFHFSIGPIPMSARLGVRGSVGVQYGLNLQASNASVSLAPQVQVDAYGQGGVDLDIASGGIGCDLVLVHDTLQLGAQAAMVNNNNGPALQAHCTGHDSLNMLSGKLYAYAKVDLGIYDKEWDWDIWNWSGVQKDYTLFDDARTLPLQPQQLVVAR